MGLTPSYSAPEQLHSEYGDIDRRTDIYQLGVVTYQLLTGRHPFEANRAIDLQEAILESTPEPPSSVGNSVPTALDGPVMQALSERPVDRHDAVVVFRNEPRDAL
jgi:serine/threonine protein kinase